MKIEILFLSWVLVFCASGNLAEAYDGGLLSAGSLSTCAIDDDKGVKCWGYNSDFQTKVPPLKNPISVSAGGSHVCALDDDGVKCWGGNSAGQIKVPYLKYPISVSAGGSHTCALDDDGVKCWGYNSDGQTKVPPLKNPISVSAGMSHTCAIHEYGLKCWGDNQSGQTNIPPLKNLISISAGNDLTCAIDDEGVKCWGRQYDVRTKVPSFKTRLAFPFSPNRVEIFLDRLAHRSTPVRTFFFNSLKVFANENLKLIGASSNQLIHGRYALIAFLKASIETGDSTDYTEKIIPVYKSRMKIINEQNGIDGLDQVEDFPLTRLTSLKVMQASLLVMTEFLPAEDKAHIHEILKPIDFAISDVSSTQAITNVLMAIETNEAIIDKLSYSSKTQFLVLTLKTALQWLKAKIL